MSKGETLLRTGVHLTMTLSQESEGHQAPNSPKYDHDVSLFSFLNCHHQSHLYMSLDHMLTCMCGDMKGTDIDKGTNVHNIHVT